MNANLHIRPALESEAGVIKQMIRAEHLDPTSLNWRHFLVAELDGKVVGIGQIKEVGGAQELGSLVVLPEFRQHRIAAQLIAALEARAGRPLFLFCRDNMEVFYARFGYRRITYREAPSALRLKWMIPRIFILFGVRIILMRKD
jgi:amino-acid N-acetyltransferase